MHRGVLVRAVQDPGIVPPLFFPTRHLLDQRRVVRAEIGEKVLDPDVVQAIEKIVRGRVKLDVGGLVHAGVPFATRNSA
jgi:hypothetical protein